VISRDEYRIVELERSVDVNAELCVADPERIIILRPLSDGIRQILTMN